MWIAVPVGVIIAGVGLMSRQDSTVPTFSPTAPDITIESPMSTSMPDSSLSLELADTTVPLENSSTTSSSSVVASTATTPQSPQ